uniref:Uncharacterized protein n=1 Tax=Anguilla anguilla TaxID=7936 RepID=A0A0E9VBG0_ANGAN
MPLFQPLLSQLFIVMLMPPSYAISYQIHSLKLK